MRGLTAALGLAALAGMASMHAPLEPRPEPGPEPGPEPAKKAKRIAAKMAKQRMRLQFGNDMPPLDNHAAKLMGLPHQGSREMVRRAKRMAGDDVGA